MRAALLCSVFVLISGAQTYAAPLCFDGGAAVPCDGRPTVLSVDGREFRTYDGYGNNASDNEWGSAGIDFLRGADAAYEGEFARPDGPDARAVSNAVAGGSPDLTVNEDGLSSMFWAWGQFIDHDVTLTAESHSETMAMSGGGDDLFGDSAMLINRSDSDLAAGGVPQQRNEITAFLDGSMVYGSDSATATSLRSLDGSGKLRMDPGDLLPTDDQGFFQAGDIRVNEQQQLTAMHTVFAREHNRLADDLSDENPAWSGERIYQEARTLVGAQIQQVTYNEWLPLLLGDEAPGSYAGYDPHVNPSLTNEFSACAFRFCHSMIPEELERLEENGDPISDGNLALRDGFFNPDEFRDAGGVEPLIRGLAQQQAMEVDAVFSDDIRNFLDLGGEENSDLFARNLARGRDHGLPDYNTLRAAYGLEAVSEWSELTDDPDLIAELTTLYGTPNGLDPYLGAMMEEHVGGGIVGALNAAIIADQFERLRAGDRFWHEQALDSDSLAWVRQRSLSDILRDNTGVEWLQDNAFVAEARGAAAPGGALLILAALGVFAARRRRVILAA